MRTLPTDYPRLPDGRPWTTGMRPLADISEDLIIKASWFIAAEAEQAEAENAVVDAKRRVREAREAMHEAGHGVLDNAKVAYRWPDLLTWIKYPKDGKR